MNIWTDIIYPVFEALQKGCTELSKFLFAKQSILGMEVSGLGILAGGGLIFLIIFSIVRIL